MARTKTNAELVTLSNDPRSMDPSTIRQVMHEGAIASDEDREFFLDCVTIRKLIEQGAIDRAALCASQLGLTLDEITNQ